VQVPALAHRGQAPLEQVPPAAEPAATSSWTSRSLFTISAASEPKLHPLAQTSSRVTQDSPSNYWTGMFPGLVIMGVSSGLSQAPMFAAAGTSPPSGPQPAALS
jgi:hypothetical protein